ncbi:sugar phosphate isomerase/epimerase family protein [Roseobacter sp. EG26]|uniref:sugar phosphate isomerase/epimerase family protein n=1 Tax=Roseobacter sp. EG26 TaxID=3412477 RepID=UPI003CE58622
MTLSFQLYSARNFLPWCNVIPRLAELGYRQVEGFAGLYTDAPAFRDLLDSHGMTMPSGHFFPLGALEGELDASLSTARILGMQRVICPAPEELWRQGTTAANWVALAKRLNEACKRVTDAGFRFGWHNHHWEFMALQDGTLPMNLLLEHAPDMEWEMDVAWALRGGADPLEWIETHADRVTAAHVKDIAPEGEKEDEDGWADLGDGVMDWETLIAALRQAGTDYFVAEHDNPSDWDRFANRSIAAFGKY